MHYKKSSGLPSLESVTLIKQLVAIFILLGICIVGNVSAVPESPKQKIKEVLVFNVNVAPLFELATYPGRVESKINAAVLAEYEGIVTSVAAPLGRKVARGQNLMVVRQTDPVYQYAPMVIRAPLSGFISQIDVSEGSRIVKGQKLATITDPSQIRIVIEIPGTDLGNFRTGLAGEFKVIGQTEACPVKISGLSPLVDSTTGTATATLEVAGQKSLPLPGILGKAEFKVNQRFGISIPEEAIIYRDKKTFVRLVVGNKAKQVPVTLGPIQNGKVEVFEGLKNGDVVIERCSGYIADGEEVNVQKAG